MECPKYRPFHRLRANFPVKNAWKCNFAKELLMIISEFGTKKALLTVMLKSFPEGSLQPLQNAF
jgi:hypothetical protein